MSDFKKGDHVTVGGYGVAFTVVGFAARQCQRCGGDGFDHTGFSDDAACRHCHGYGEIPTGKLEVCIVGDDFVHVVSPDDCRILAGDAFCGSCGQIGCSH